MYNDTALCDYSFVGGACPHNQRENMMARHTHRGTCQVCGSVQAVNNKTGMIAKHGYTVDWGMFQGECPGSNELPIEKSYRLTIQIIDSIQSQLAGMKLIDLKPLIENFSSDLSAARKNNLQYQAMTDHIAALKKLFNQRHGQDLYLAPKEEKVERIHETFSRIQDAYRRAEELKTEGWKPRVTGWYKEATLTATRKAA